VVLIQSCRNRIKETATKIGRRAQAISWQYDILLLTSALPCWPIFGIPLCSIEEGEKSDGFVQRLTEKIIDNVQLTITGIHIRYEDPDDLPRGFSFGIGLDQLTAYTTGPEFGERKFVTGASKVFKKVILPSPAISFDANLSIMMISENRFN
jgi:hypothetical protein